MLGWSPVRQRADVWNFNEYKAFMERTWPKYQNEKVAQRLAAMRREYLVHLPVYLVARCPICRGEISEPVDTFSLNGLGWRDHGVGYGWSGTLAQPEGPATSCPHLRILAYYLNLRGRTPDDLFVDKKIYSGPEAPSIMRVPMAAPGALAVIHEVPVGRFDDDAPRHHYSVYFVSYFTEDKESFQMATKSWGIHYGFVEYDDIDYDLASWGKNGRLTWLRPSDPQLPEVRWGEEEFPYGNIAGDRFPYRLITRRGVETMGPTFLSRILNLFHRRNR